MLIDFQRIKSFKEYHFFCEKQKYERGRWLKVKIYVWFYGDNSRTETNEIWYSKRSWTYLQVLFESLF
jgi:hypothetical protein